MPDLYAVMGNPIGHSKSPRIHSLFAQQTQQDIRYDAILVEPGHFPQAVADFRARGGRGLNVTVPFKLDAFSMADRHTPRAQRAGAVNTLVLKSGAGIVGDNTDGIGLVRDLLQNHGATVRGKRVLLLGAGGAARGILEPVLAQCPGVLVIGNRTPDKALQLARDFCDLGPVEGCGFPSLEGQAFELVINATAAGLHGAVPELPPGILAQDACCYDLMYGDGPTAFVEWAQRQGAGYAADGLGMLVEQAAESFYLWRGVRPETQVVISALRKEINS